MKVMKQKLNNAYKSIGEVAKDLNLVNSKTGKLNTHTIRFWEKEFKQIKPKIFAGQRRYYDQETIRILKKIRFLLKEKGFTIKGVKNFLVNESSFNLDETSNNSINISKNNLKSKIEKISSLVKQIKKLS
ncbi:MerR family transcriptional regulator [Candidatus Pelagibacter sp.]|nr:MerR family transcriptional regulator [Candidatus Pelagibacter sp.]